MKYIVQLLVVVIIITLSIGGTAYASQVSALTGGLQGRILGVLEIPKAAITVPFSASEKDVITNFGWVETDTTFRREGGLGGVTVRIRDFTTVTDAEGRYSLTGIPAGSYQLQISFEGQTLASRSVVVIAGRLRDKDIYAVHRVVDQPMHAEETQVSASDGQIQPLSSHIPCLDYNGPFGNPYCVHVHTPQNFFLSDCDWAYFAAGCWRDHTSSPYCNGSRNCSPYITNGARCQSENSAMLILSGSASGWIR